MYIIIVLLYIYIFQDIYVFFYFNICMCIILELYPPFRSYLITWLSPRCGVGGAWKFAMTFWDSMEGPSRAGGWLKRNRWAGSSSDEPKWGVHLDCCSSAACLSACLFTLVRFWSSYSCMLLDSELSFSMMAFLNMCRAWKWGCDWTAFIKHIQLGDGVGITLLLIDIISHQHFILWSWSFVYILDASHWSWDMDGHGTCYHLHSLGPAGDEFTPTDAWLETG